MASDALAAASLLISILVPGSHRLLGNSRVERRELDALNADLYLPPRARVPGFVLALGALREGRRYPILESTARAIAARGFAVLVPELGRLRSLVLGVDALDDLVEATSALRDQAGVTDAPVGLIGFSLGGSLALVAAGDPRLHGRIACVAAMGSYFRLTDMLDAAVGGFAGPNGEPMALAAPSAYTVAASLVDRLADPDGDALAQVIDRQRESPLEALSRVDRASVGRPAEVVLELLRTRDANERRALIDRVDGLGELLDDLSPERAIGRIEAPVWILHDERDRYVPFDQFLALREATRGRGDFTFLGIRLLEHTEPVAPVLNPIALVRDYLPGVRNLYRFARGPLAAVRDAAR